MAFLTHNSKRPPQGFTLIETLLAVLILSMALAGPLTIASRSMQTALVAKDQTIAYYLAQDAVEYVRFARDTNTLKNTDWLAGSGGNSTDLSPCKSTGGTAACYLDSLSQNPTRPIACEDSLCSLHKLYYDATNNYFTYNTNATQTLFTRAISITAPAGGTEASLVVTVTWSDMPNVTHKVVVKEYLYDWR